MEVLTRIVQLREERGWTLYQLANKAGLAYKTLYNWYNGDSIPTIKALEAIAEAFEVPLCELFTTDKIFVANGASSTVTSPFAVLITVFCVSPLLLMTTSLSISS